MEAAPKKDEIRILVSGGYFIGEFEQNPDLAQVAAADEDAYNLLFETLKIARESADFVIVLGNLFFLNNPSNESLTNTLSVLKESVLGDGDIGFVVRKYDPNFANSTPCSPENLNVCMPVFAIHGGYDSPSAENLTSSLDIVHYSSYVPSPHSAQLRWKDHRLRRHRDQTRLLRKREDQSRCLLPRLHPRSQAVRAAGHQQDQVQESRRLLLQDPLRQPKARAGNG